MLSFDNRFFVLCREAAFVLSLVAFGFISQPDKALAQQAGRSCDLALILALDASSSVDPAEYELQKKGLAAALLDAEVTAAIQALGGMQLMAYEWSGRYHQEEMVGWTYLLTPVDVSKFALALASHNRVYSDFPTALGYSLGYASNRFRELPDQCLRQVVDVSGDGENNEGFGPRLAYVNFAFERITVNGLVIKGADPDPEEFYRSEVLFGPGSFLEVANDFNDYERAIKRKLLREIGSRSVSRVE